MMPKGRTKNMGSLMSIERVSAKLLNEQGSYAAQLDLDVVGGTVDELSAPVFRVISNMHLTLGAAVPNGAYTLQFVFDGRPFEKKVHVESGNMFAGWVLL